MELLIIWAFTALLGCYYGRYIIPKQLPPRPRTIYKDHECQWATAATLLNKDATNVVMVNDKTTGQSFSILKSEEFYQLCRENGVSCNLLGFTDLPSVNVNDDY